MSRILIIEDEEAIADLEKDYLELSGFEVEIENRGDTGLVRAMKEEFDLIILDLMLPEVDGFDICRQVREEKNTPIIMVSAKKDDIDKIRGLGLGADDYMTKPFSMEELIFRIEAILRRIGGESDLTQSAFKLGKFTFDARKQTLSDATDSTKLTTKESELLRLLCVNANKVLERNFALKTIWVDDNYFYARSMDVYITKLRKHLKDEEGIEIINVHGKGYKLIM